MATYYVWSGATGANNGTSWTDAYTLFTDALAAAGTNGDIIKVHKTHQDAAAPAATQTLNHGANISVICVDKDAGDALAVMGTGGWIGHSGPGYQITVSTSGTYVYWYGITLRSGATTTARLIMFATDGAQYDLEQCYVWNGSTHSSTTAVGIAFGTGDQQVAVRARNLTLRLSSALSRVFNAAALDIVGGRLSSDGSAITTVFQNGFTDSPTAYANIIGFDFTAASSTAILVGAHTTSPARYTFVDCKLPSSVVPLSVSGNLSEAEVWLYNCANGDQHYHMAHYNPLGQTTIDTGIYANDNVADTDLSWKIVTSGEAGFSRPYISPWIDVYNDDTSAAITPYLECVRSGSSIAYQDDEVWAEVLYQGTSGSVLPVLVTDRMTPLGTPANQTASSKGASDWTGEAATSWFGKLGPASSFTPAEVGHIRARVCVGEPSTTLYVDPQIRGLA
jgi:hypothetical protein